MNEKRIIVNADDFGMSVGISDAILVAHRYGFLTSASLMANMPASEYAVEQSSRAPKLGVGIHLNICEGRPILAPAEVPSLVDSEGNFLPPHKMIRKLWRWQCRGDEIEAEFRAQISWMKRQGLRPTHADSHHHMHIYPAAIRPFARALKAEDVSRTRASRFRYSPQSRHELGPHGIPHKEAHARRLAVRTYRSILQSTLLRGFTSPDGRLAFRAFGQNDRDAIWHSWRSAFEDLRCGTYELACHPGLFDPAFSRSDRIHYLREAELHCLTDRALREVLERRQVQLITYNDLAHRSIVEPSAAKVVVS